MPEESKRGVVPSTGGFYIRRVGSPTAPVTGPRRPVIAATAAVGPTWHGRRATRSPLPEWYTRTPLRDITAIVNAVERRRLLEAARLAQTNRDSEEPSVSGGALPIDSTPEPTRTCIASFDSPVEHPLQMSCSSSSCSPADSPIEHSTTPKTKQQSADEEMLCSSIDQIEKIVMRNLKKSMKREPAIKREVQRRNLMSMR